MTVASPSSKPANFRYDINGLRALAVITVVIFHFRHSWLTGGFIGVDVFFVISGFLMTQIIIRGLENNTFSLWQFLKRRFFRIAPALTVVVLVMLVLGFLLYEPLSYKIMGKHGLSSLLFFSNNTYKHEVGYFDLEAITKVFLHTWSVAIEFQFYIVYPIVLWILSRFLNVRQLGYLILVLTIVLFGLNVYLSSVHPDQSYFLLQCRVWEMLFGGLAFMFPLRVEHKLAHLLELAGIALIILGCFFIDTSKVAWPSWAALVPVVGAYLCIINASTTVLLANPISQFLGTVSYSLYLLHWPLLSFLNHLKIELNFFVYAVITLVLTVLLHYTVERRRRFGWIFMVVFVVTALAALYVKQDGVAERLQDKTYALSLQDFREKHEGFMDYDIHHTEPIYFNSADHDPDYILWGDSHARHYFYFIHNHGLKVVSLALDGCQSTENYYLDRRPECEGQYAKVIDMIKAHPHKTVVMSMWWGDGYDARMRSGGTGKFQLIPELTEIYNVIAASGSKLVLIGLTPSTPYVPYQCLAQQNLPLNRLLGSVDCPETQPYPANALSVNKKLEEFAATHDNVQFIDAAKALCQNGRCQIRNGDQIIYTDKDHLSKYGSDLVGKYIFSQIKQSE